MILLLTQPQIRVGKSNRCRCHSSVTGVYSFSCLLRKLQHPLLIWCATVVSCTSDTGSNTCSEADVRLHSPYRTAPVGVSVCQGCSLSGFLCGLSFVVFGINAGGSRLLRNVPVLLPSYTASHHVGVSAVLCNVFCSSIENITPVNKLGICVSKSDRPLSCKFRQDHFSYCFL